MVVTGRTASRLLRDVLSSDEQGRLLPRSAELDLTTSWADVARQVLAIGAEQRPMTTLSVALAGLRITEWGRLPFVSTYLDAAGLTGRDTRRRPRSRAPGASCA
jgi:hypothetical protein